ncbi:MAG: secondary thiamine-phosphate synthase enzyme YjbQ [Actinomycetota bacterium]|nr:secondary thiamine-phosphate synthase enzyme YjbQ [Actinomycetota bacterium]
MNMRTLTVDIQADKRFGFVDITDELIRAVKDSGITQGLSVAYCSHTTCTLLINEWEDGVLDDLAARLHQLVPSGVYYAHDDLERRTQNVQSIEEPENGQAHVIQMIVGGASHVIPVEDGEPVLGRWQRLFLLELDEPRSRRILFSAFGV